MAKKVEVISSCLVGGTAAAAATSMSRLELLPWDLRALQIVPIQRGLTFRNPQIQSQRFLIQHLKSSLSHALDLFPPLAGRLATTPYDGDGGTVSFFVDCNNAGAEFTHAIAATASVADIIEPRYIPEIVSSLFPLNGAANNFEGISKPLVAVQVTELADGLFIGCSANHAVVDGTSFWHFFKSWSEISRGSDAISQSPVFERYNAAAGDDNRLVHLPSLEKNLVAPSQFPQKVFHFSKENLVQLKAKANSEAGTDKISTLQALLAHLWRSAVRSQTIEDSTTRVMIIAIGARARMPSLSDGYFGNASYTATSAISEIDLLQKGLGTAALKINEVISQQSNEAIRRNAEEKVEFRAFGPMGGKPPLIIASSPRHDVYGCDFGWGKPIGVRSGRSQKVEGLVVVFPAAEAGGIDVEVCLAEEALQAMECDAESEFMSVDPSKTDNRQFFMDNNSI